MHSGLEDDGRLYTPARTQWSNINPGSTLPANGANGSLLSSLSDLIQWDAALTRVEILSRRPQDALWSPLILANGEVVSWTVQDSHGHKLIEFSVRFWGFTTCMTRFVDDQLTVIILTN